MRGSQANGRPRNIVTTQNPGGATLPKRIKGANDLILVLSSGDMEAEERAVFATQDPPPQLMRIPVKVAGLSVNIANTNVNLAVHVRRYFLDAVWRDADDPSTRIAPNSGTSISKDIFVTFYVGNIENNIRLITQPLITPTPNNDFDYVIVRQTTNIGEVASNPYATVETSDVTTYFENSFTCQGEYFGAPGELLGYASAQALAALKSAGYVTVRMVNDRTDSFRSPFWYNRFLSGVSLWDEDASEYDVVPAETERVKYHTKVSQMTVTKHGGPYFPRTLYTFADPVRAAICSFIPEGSMTGVAANVQFCYPLLNSSVAVSMSLTQIGMRGSTDLADIDSAAATAITTMLAPSDSNGTLTCAVYDTVSGTVTPVNLSTSARFGGHALPSPNGAWRGAAFTATPTPQPNFLSCFPWEISLSRQLLRIVNEVDNYASVASFASKEVVPRHNYIFMDAGSDFDEDVDPSSGGSVTIGERAMQFDLGAGNASMVNRVDLLFPRSQEDSQPIYLGASLQREYGTTASTYDDLPLAVWMGGFQAQRPYGDVGGLHYLNTHTQTSFALDGSSAPLMNVIPGRSPSDSPYSGTAAAPVFVSFSSSKVVPADASTSFVSGQPNEIVPSYDYQRQEFGPFVRGATYPDLEDPALLKAIIYDGTTAEWASRQYTLGHYFTSLADFCAGSSQASNFFRGRVYMIQAGLLATPTAADLLAGGTTFYIYPTSYSDVSPNSALVKATFTNLAEYIMANFAVYLVDAADVNSPSAADTPAVDYIVKETFYPSPFYDQYDSNTVEPASGSRPATLRPATTSRAQKMVTPEYAVGRYFGLSFGSALGRGGSARMTRGITRRNQLRAYAVRLGTQMFDFTTEGGQVPIDTSLPPPSVDEPRAAATFRKQYTGGVLSSANVTSGGAGFIGRPGTTIDSVPTFPSTSTSHAEALIAMDNTGPVARTIEFLPNALPSSTGGGATLSATLADSTAYPPISFVKASSKSVLHRSAEFHLLLSPTQGD